MSDASEITGLEGTVTALAFSPDGKFLAAADSGFDLTLWDIQSGKSLARLNGLATGTNRVCWSPDGKLIYGTSGNDWISWDVVSTKQKLKIKAEMTRTAPSSIALSADGQTVAAAGRGMVKLWASATGAVIGEYEPHPNYALNSVAFSPDGKFVVTTSNDRNAQLTRVADGTPGRTFTCPSKVVTAEFSPDGKTLFVVDQTPALHQFDVATGEDRPATGLQRVPRQIAVSNDGHWVACAGPTLQLWSTSGASWSEHRFEASRQGVTAVAFSRDGKWLACSFAEGQIQILALQTLVGKK